MLQRRIKYKRIQILFATGLLFLLISGCAKDEGPFIVRPVKLPGDTLLSLTSDIQPIFDSHCIRCHNQSHPFLDLRDGYSYNQLLFTGHLAPYIDSTNPENSILIGRLRGIEYPIMPPDGDHLLPATIDSIVLWMAEGARE